eukprot:symbB.v1.2.022520.t2/scaffold2003.1/size92810/7
MLSEIQSSRFAEREVQPGQCGWRHKNASEVLTDPKSTPLLGEQVALQLHRPMATSATARSDGGRPKNVWELVESNLEVFNVKKLLQILVPLSSMDKVGKADQRIVRLLQRAMKYVEGGGAIVSVVGAKEAAAIVQVTQRLGTKEAKRFNLSWLGAMTAQVNDLPVDLVAQLTQELLVSKVSDRELWHALVETTTKRSHEMGPAEIVCLMDGFRRSYNAFGTEPHRAVQALCQRTLECCQAGSIDGNVNGLGSFFLATSKMTLGPLGSLDDFLPRHCVGTLGSVCRMGALLYNWQRYQVLHHLLDKWLVCQGPSWETTPSNQVVSVAVSLNSAPEIMNPRIDHFLDGASSWAEHDAVAGGALSAEDFVVLLWALKQLTPVGLSRYPKLVSLALPRIRDKAEYKNFTLVLLASKHALVDSQGTDISYEDILKTMEPPLVAALAKKVAEAPIDLLGKVLTIGSQGDVDFWQRCSLLTEAVLRRAVELTSNQVWGYGMTGLGKLKRSATELMQEALSKSLKSAGLQMKDLDGLVAVPSLSHPHFMEAHYLATQVGLLPRPTPVRVRTLDTGGAGPVSGLLEAVRMVKDERCHAVAVVAGDAVSSLETREFLKRADQGCQDPENSLPSPCIPHGYDQVAQWLIRQGGITREQLAMVSVLMSRQAARHPEALTRKAHTLEEVLTSRSIAPATNLLECARRADGGAAIIVASSSFMDDYLGHDAVSSQDGDANPKLGPVAAGGGIVVLGGGEASGPLYPPVAIDETMFSCEAASRSAFSEAQLLPEDIQWFGLYDCYPVCFVRALEACGVTEKGQCGRWVEKMFHLTEKTYEAKDFPINTHGGLLAFGAPWEVPAMYNIIEACEQIRGNAMGRQVPSVRRALVYGNGGIFSHSAVAILAKAVD